MPRATALFRLYQAASALTVPFFARAAVNKLRRAGVPVMRAHERLGHATSDRRFGPLIWLHAACVDEATSVLPLMHHIAQTAPHVRMVLTTSTATSAEAVAPYLPDGTVHQFSALDAIGPLDRFLSHWRPDLCLLVASELWPNLLDRCARRDLPVALLDAHLTDSSARGWQKFPDTTAFVLRGVGYAHCQDQRTRDHLRAMGLDFARSGANLKSLTTAPKVARDTRDAAHAALNGRPIWVAAATHVSDEAPLLAAHKSLLRDHPNLCLILAPRHPDRAKKVLALIADAGFSVAQRSAGGALDDGAEVYLADTTDEMDLWYALSPIVFLGGSFSGDGNRTPLEPAAAHTAIVHGPRYGEFSEAYTALQLADASVEVTDDAALATTIHDLLAHPSRAAQLAANARSLARDSANVLPNMTQDLLALALIDDLG